VIIIVFLLEIVLILCFHVACRCVIINLMKVNKIQQKENGFLPHIRKGIRDIVFGLEDGLVSTLGVIIGIAEGSRSSYVVILSGIVVVFVEALSMAAGTFLSAKSNKEVLEEKIRKEKLEIKNKPGEETEELYEIYREQGLSREDAKPLVEQVIKNENVWLEEMKLHELGITDAQLENPKINALFMGVSYIIAGSVPVLAFFFLPIDSAVILSVILTVVALFFVGAGKTIFTKKSWLKSGAEMTLIALAAAALGFVIGKVVAYFY